MLSPVRRSPGAPSPRAGLLTFALIFCALICTGCERREPATSTSANATSPQHNSTDSPSETSSKQDSQGSLPFEALDKRLSGFAYPFETKNFTLQWQGNALEMAYMDVAPGKSDEADAKKDGAKKTDTAKSDTAKSGAAKSDAAKSGAAKSGAAKSGAAPKHAVLLLHGKNFSGAYWGETIKALNRAGHRVIAPDQIGFGKSSKPIDVQYSFHQLAQNTRALLEHLGITRVDVVGHSMGGMLALRFALMYPNLTNKLALINPIGLEDYKRFVPYSGVDAWRARNMKLSPASIKAYMTRNYFDGAWKDAYDPLLAIQAGWAQGEAKEHMAMVSALHYDMIMTQPVVHELGDVKVPTLLIIGQRDRTALGKNLVSDSLAQELGDYPKLGRQTARAIPGAVLFEMAGIGHIPHFEARKRTHERLNAFLRPER